MNLSSDNFNNPKKVREWYLGICLLFNHIRNKNKWSKQEAWDKLAIQLINTVGSENFIPDDLDWIKSILYHDKFPTTEECLRVAQRYPDETPLLDALKKLI